MAATDETAQFVSALADFVDCRVLAVLRDGRKLVGFLRSYDQFANLVLQDTVERIHTTGSAAEYADIPRGIFLLRGENLVLLGTATDNHISAAPNAAQSVSISQVAVESVLAAQQSTAEYRVRLSKFRESVVRNTGLGAEMESEAY